MDRSFASIMGVSAAFHAAVLMAAGMVEPPRLDVRTGPMSVQLAAIPKPVPVVKTAPTPVVEKPKPPEPVAEPVVREPEPRPVEEVPQVASLAHTGAVDVMPRPLAFNLPPKYPERARRAGQEGRVVLRMKVLRDGKVGQVTMVESSGFTLLDEAASRAASGYLFEPARLAGVAVPHTVVIPFEFSLERQTWRR